MVQKVITTLTDDIDGSDADETVRFALDGAVYEIDLNNGHAKSLRDALAAYIKGARRTGKPAGKPRRVRSARPAEIREWAASVGLTVNERGRIPEDIQAAYADARANPGHVPYSLPPEPAAARTEPSEPGPGPADDGHGYPVGSAESMRAWAARTEREVKPFGQVPKKIKAEYWEEYGPAPRPAFLVAHEPSPAGELR